MRGAEFLPTLSATRRLVPARATADRIPFSAREKVAAKPTMRGRWDRGRDHPMTYADDQRGPLIRPATRATFSLAEKEILSAADMPLM